MTWESPEDRRRRFRDRLLAIAVLATVAWATLAFGGVYRWAYVPLLVACTAIGCAGIARRIEDVPRLASSVPVWLAVVAVGALLQLVPLPATALARISPATDAFLKSHLFAYAIPADVSGVVPSHPLSLAPQSTWLAVAFLLALTVLLAGMMRWLRPPLVPMIARALVALGVLVAVMGIAQKALDSHEVWDLRIYGVWKPRYQGTPFGPFVNRNHFAGWMLMILPLALAYFAATLEAAALSGIGRSWRNRLLWLGSERAGQAVTAGFAVLVMAVALVYANSRSGLACALFVLAAVGWMAARSSVGRRVRVTVGVVLAVVAASSLVWAGSDIIMNRFTLVPAEIGDRLGTWRDALRIVRDFPLAGVGLNAYGTASYQYQTVVSQFQYTTAHNDYLQLAAEGGLLLTIPATLALVALVRAIVGNVRQRADDRLVGWLRAGALVGLGAIALQSFVDFSLQIPANAVLFVLIASIAAHRPAVVARRPATRGKEVSPAAATSLGR